MTQEGTPPPEAPPPDPEPVDDPTKLKALYDKKMLNKTLRARTTTAEATAKAATEALENYQKESMSEVEKQIASARKEATDEVEAKYQGMLKTERLKNRAAGKINDPEDAVRLIDISNLDLDDNDAMDKAITDLVKAKPYLAAAPGKVPSIDQGPHGDEPTPPKEDANSWLRRAILGR